MERRTAVVMGRNYTSRLGMIRAAGEAGCDVAVIQTDKDGNANRKPVDSFSKYINRGYLLAPQPDSEKLIDILLQEFSGEKTKPILLPTDDYTASVIDTNIDRLKGAFLFPSIGEAQGSVVRLMDKGVQKSLARSVGFSVANGWSAEWKNGSYVIPEDVVFPCFIKPEISYKGSNKQSMQKCDSREQLTRALSGIDGREDYPILIEEFVNIEREYAVLGCSLLDAVITPGVIEMVQGDYGVTARGTIRPVSEYGDLQTLLSSFMKKTGFTGLFDIDLYENEGQIYFNELNLRFGASGFAVTRSGVNLPGLFIKWIAGEECVQNDSRIEIRSFVNEKVLLQLLSKQRIGWKEYLRLKKDADLLFVEDKADPKPAAELKKTEEITAAKYMIKRVLRMR